MSGEHHPNCRRADIVTLSGERRTLYSGHPDCGPCGVAELEREFPVSPPQLDRLCDECGEYGQNRLTVDRRRGNMRSIVTVCVRCFFNLRGRGEV